MIPIHSQQRFLIHGLSLINSSKLRSTRKLLVLTELKVSSWGRIQENDAYGNVVHGANGYLVSQFIDSTANKRTDEWGGSIENRARFVLETLKVLKEVFGNNVAIKLTPCGGYNDVGCVRSTLTESPDFRSDLHTVCLCKKH